MEGISGCGLGLRREFLFDVENYPTKPDWFEIAPENWIKTPKKLLKEFERIVAEHEIVCHGLSLSIGSLDDLDLNFLKDLKTFLDKYEIKHYSEHISFSSLENVQTYELLPIPMTKDMIKHITERVDFIQNFLKRELILENATYYYVPQSDMSEIEFINGVIKESGAKLLLDVNNVFVNGHNHNFDPKKFIDSLDKDSISYYHVAGHLEQSDEI
ncbi:MAG: DUF692 domain-containing protein, partial [Campylobacterales bacterium]|nr:DUF692 domain-containing protein [Campylobacterales bacterium]